MANGMNKVFLLGNLGDDPELRHASNGAAHLKLRLATSQTWRDKETGDRKEKTEWHNVALWGPRAESLHRILNKGEKVMVEGRLETRSYQDREGQTRYYTEVKARDIVLTGSGRRPRPAEVPLPEMPDVMDVPSGRKTAPASALANA